MMILYYHKLKVQKMKKNIALIIFTLMLLSGLNAQKYQSSSSGTGWYAGVNAGVNLFVSENYAAYLTDISKMPKAIGNNIGLTLGYDFSSVWGARAVFANQNFNWPFDSQLTIKSFSSPQLIFDAVLNLNNALKFNFLNGNSDILLYAGAGGFYRPLFGTLPPVTSYVLQGGGQFNFHVDTNWDITLAGEINATDDRLNSIAVDGVPLDLFPAVKIGFIYHFDGDGNKKCMCYY